MISRIWEAKVTSKRLDIDPYCQGQNCICSPLKCTFQRCVDYVDITGRSSDWGIQSRTAVARLGHTFASARLSCKI